MAKRFQNKHLSVSRIKRYEQCPLSFKLNYIDKKKSSYGEATDIGKFLHIVLETIFKWVIEEEYSGIVDGDRVKEVFDELWVNSQDGMRLSGIDLYEEGLKMILEYMEKHGPVDPYDHMSTEHPFNITVESSNGKSYVINGIIDRIDVKDDSVIVVDYKSNRLPFTKSEIETDLQMSLYTYAVKKIWPEFADKRVLCEYHMLRLGYIQRPHEPRTDEECENAIRYMIKIAERTENPECTFPHKLNAYCCYCDQSHNCDVYQDIASGKVGIFKLKSLPITSSDLLKLSQHREVVSSVAGISYKRKKEIDELLKARLEREKDITIGDLVYYVSTPVDREYDPNRLIKLLARYGVSIEEVIEKVLVVRKESLKQVVEKLRESLDNSHRAMLTAELSAIEKRTPSTPRLNVRKSRDLQDGEGNFRVRRAR